MTKPETDERIKVGITQGDINGIGYEVIIKTLANPRILKYVPLLYMGHQRLHHITGKLLMFPNLI